MDNLNRPANFLIKKPFDLEISIPVYCGERVFEMFNQETIILSIHCTILKDVPHTKHRTELTIGNQKATFTLEEIKE